MSISGLGRKITLGNKINIQANSHARKGRVSNSFHFIFGTATRKDDLPETKITMRQRRNNHVEHLIRAQTSDSCPPPSASSRPPPQKKIEGKEKNSSHQLYIWETVFSSSDPRDWLPDSDSYRTGLSTKRGGKGETVKKKEEGELFSLSSFSSLGFRCHHRLSLSPPSLSPDIPPKKICVWGVMQEMHGEGRKEDVCFHFFGQEWRGRKRMQGGKGVNAK